MVNNITTRELIIDRDVINLLSDARNELMDSVGPKSILDEYENPIDDSISWLNTSRKKLVLSRKLEDYELKSKQAKKLEDKVAIKAVADIKKAVEDLQICKQLSASVKSGDQKEFLKLKGEAIKKINEAIQRMNDLAKLEIRAG